MISCVGLDLLATNKVQSLVLIFVAIVILCITNIVMSAIVKK
ncbi:hypothetical protein C942_01532 [Photobacterium marinum]|uniref:Uncharacterized protein n=1 Tax=Photobacterium marinum TaxID=1056511 RepID=L8JJJ1_9GAMM|nr:hypothetical protein C942_01532 [Photobacterium marinum]